MNDVNFKIGDEVIIRNENKLKNQKPYFGPFKIIDLNGVNVTLNCNRKNNIIHKDRLKLIYK